jgi:Fe-S cluster assembly protein SufD
VIDTLAKSSLDAQTIQAFSDAAKEPQWLRAVRSEAFQRYAALPVPGERTQGWRRADLAGIDLQAQSEAPSPYSLLVDSRDRAVGVAVLTLADAVRTHTDIVREALERVHRGQTLGKFSALAESAWQEGAFIYVPPGVTLSQPIEVVSVSGPYPRLLVVLGREARACVLEVQRSAERLSCAVADLIVNDGAHLTYARVQECAANSVVFSHQRARLSRDAKLVTFNFGAGGRMSRADIEVELLGPGAESDMLGLISGDGAQQFDYHTVQGHRAPDTRSDLLFKSALNGTAHAVYTGVIIIEKPAQRSDAYQANRNLLLGEGARADTEPMLEIEANDVRCTHGATVGPIDEEQMFYLRSRGLSEELASRLIVEGFFEEVFQKVGDDRLTAALRSKIAPDLVAEPARA